MQDQNDLEPVTSTTVLGESDQYSLSERLDVNVVDQRYSTESLIQEDIDNKENMSPFNYEHGVNENLDQVIFGQSGFLGQANRSEEGAELEEDFIEDAEVRTTPVEAIENTTMQPSKYQQIEPAKPYNSLLLVQEFHTGLTSCDDSGESGEEGDDCKEEGEESDDDDDDEDDNNDSDDCSDIDDDIGEEEEYEDRHKQSIRTPSEAMQPILQSPPLSRTIDYEFIALKAFRPDPTPEEIVERRKNLEKYGLMFSRDEYTYYMENRIVNPPEDEEYYKEVQDVVASITEKERNWRIDADSKRKQGEELNVVAKRKRSVSPAAPNPPVEPDFGTMDHNTVELVGLELSSVTDAISSLNSVNVETSAPHLTNVLAPAVSTKPLKKPNPPSAVLDAVLTNILRESQSAQKLKIGESSDLEAAAMAAGLILNDTDGTTTKRGPQSRLSKQEHAEFLKCNEMLKNGQI
ncbi:hypothetical protein BD408DRAFT_248224 [Parasitella parasitica]|nr:hypothetical protein BD408DRAFT_248224 [Parasitella parasitica]